MSLLIVSNLIGSHLQPLAVSSAISLQSLSLLPHSCLISSLSLQPSLGGPPSQLPFVH